MDIGMVISKVFGGSRNESSQSEMLEKYPEEYREGVCRALTLEWLVNGGTVKYLNLNGVQRKSHKVRIQDAQDMNSAATTQYLRERGVDGYGGENEKDITYTPGDNQLAHFVTARPSICYISLRPKAGGVGHAIGGKFKSRASSVLCRFYDPNYGEFTFEGPACTNYFKNALGTLQSYYLNVMDFDSVKVKRYSMPHMVSPNYDD